MEQSAIKSVITTNDQFLRGVFSRSKAFYIDIYQREYKWKEHNVETLLNDIELKFDLNKRTKELPIDIQAEVINTFEPYYINTFLTYAEPSYVSIVDGQQRLTTFLLILIKLKQILTTVEEDDTYKERTFKSDVISKMIHEEDDFGSATRFKIYNENRESVLRSVLEDNTFTPSDETQTQIVKNYNYISAYYEKLFRDDGKYDIIKLTYYITYLLDCISIVEIKIQQQKNVSMVFEVVNDRGLGLRPYEILKGKFIGNLPANEKEDANKIWTEKQNEFFNNGLSLDDFFQTYFRSKYADSKNDYDAFSDDSYHNEILKNKRSRQAIASFSKKELLFSFIKKEFIYYSELFIELYSSFEYEFVFYNRENQQNQQLMLILSAISYQDADKKEKIDLVSQKFDQMYSILNLLNVFDSREIQSSVHELNKAIRGGSLKTIADAFDSKILDVLIKKSVVQENIQSLPDVFKYEVFSRVGNSSANFSKYVLMRIDRYLAGLLDVPSYVRCTLTDLKQRLKARYKYGIHLEHILAHNSENHSQFIDEETKQLNEAEFNETRNQLGMLLLLKDRQNISSSNETYDKKFSRYDKSDFIWNRLLVGHLDKVDVKNLPDELKNMRIKPEDKLFPKDMIRNRQKAIFYMIKRIWDI